MGNHLINETLMEEEETFQTSAASHLKCLLPLFVSAIYACAGFFYFYFSAAYVLMCFNFMYVLLCFVLCFYNMI
jgi:hypothetical protein